MNPPEEASVGKNKVSIGAVTFGTYSLAIGLALCILATYKSSGVIDIWAYGSSLSITGLSLLVWCFRKYKSIDSSKFWLVLIANILGMFSCLAAGEIVLRFSSESTPFGQRIGAMTLVPFQWEQFSDENLSNLARSREETAFFVADTTLGWTVGRDRESRNGLYRSSKNGLRSRERGEDLATRTSTSRVALFGDSFTFGLDVAFDQTWAHFLSERLPPGTDVLNFGVDGYGIDQAYLRFEREAIEWHPQVAVLSFIQDDLYRNVGVYPFLRGWEYPFSKPRFIVDSNELTLVNIPNLPPETIFGKASIYDLPFLDLDLQFHSHEWQDHPLFRMYLFRFFASRFPIWPTPNGSTDDNAVVQLGSRLLEAFMGATRDREIEGVIFYLPSQIHFVQDGSELLDKVAESLMRSGIDLHDLTPCIIEKVSEPELFLESGGHYSAAGNAAVAECAAPIIAPYSD